MVVVVVVVVVVAARLSDCVGVVGFKGVAQAFWCTDATHWSLEFVGTVTRAKHVSTFDVRKRGEEGATRWTEREEHDDESTREGGGLGERRGGRVAREGKREWVNNEVGGESEQPFYS